MSNIELSSVDWKVVDRLRKILEQSQGHEYNGTLAYGLCVAILAWVMQRICIDKSNSPKDEAAIAVKKELEKRKRIEEFLGIGIEEGKNRFSGFTSVFDFLKKFRNACAHGDGRTIVPENKGEFLIGFTIDFNQHNQNKTSRKYILLKERELRNIGIAVARLYCEKLSAAE
ncbi:MAG: hypothetical protein LBG69_06595 [Zoogloeaceae bacterium]|jgi:Fe-S cluster assembly iron-binding protein IscA|nr:hypothetical protein [Zoogloeaceae bacterium]